MVAAYVQSTKQSVATGALTTPAFAAPTVAGRLIVVALNDDSGFASGTLQTVSDNKGNTYTKIISAASPSWCAPAPTGRAASRWLGARHWRRASTW